MAHAIIPTRATPESRRKMSCLAWLWAGSCLCLSGCAAPDRAFVRAERATYQAIAPEYTSYVDADERLSIEQKARRLRTVQTWDLSIRQQEIPGGASERQ